MDPWITIVILISLTAGFAYLNYITLRLPQKIGLMAISLLAAGVVLFGDHLGLPAAAWVDRLVTGVDFQKVLLEEMLGVLLFAGALHVDLEDLADRGLEVGILSTLGVAASTFLVGLVAWGLSGFLGLGLPFVHCLLFGALISPTDPIAVVGILRTLGAPAPLKAKLTGESLFNDGVGVVVFLAVLEAARMPGGVGAGQVLSLLATEAAGGLIGGLVLGYVAYLMLKSVDSYPVEVLITLALVLGGYALVSALHLSGPISMVVAGLLIGNRGRRLAMSDATREHLDTFWELIDEILNAVLFVLIGLEVLVLSLTGQYLLAGALAVPLVLLVRLITVGLPIGLLSRWRAYAPRTVAVLTWGGLRGGISVALALGLPADLSREPILTMTYVVVVFSILVQGLTLKYVMPPPPRAAVGESGPRE